MGILSSSISITRYKVQGKIENPVLETVLKGFKKHLIQDIDNEAEEKSVGWTSFFFPFKPFFDDSSFVLGTYFIFSLRIDKKTIPAKIMKKYYMIEVEKKKAETSRENLSKTEKQSIKEYVKNLLLLRIPATPNIYDVLWNMESEYLWFFSNLKSANEELETLFAKSFGINLVRIFPYTGAVLNNAFNDVEMEILSTLSPSRFTE